jgi:hypothetical protein
MRRRVTLFVSYAHSNRLLASDLLRRLRELLAPSRSYDYKLWQDTAILVGEDWEQRILAARDQCDLGLLLISPAFLGSRFIGEQELPMFVSGRKASVPVMLQPVDFVRHDLKGLERQQIFRLHYPGFSEPRSYGECRSKRRADFAMALFRAIEDKLDETLP